MASITSISGSIADAKAAINANFTAVNDEVSSQTVRAVSDAGSLTSADRAVIFSGTSYAVTLPAANSAGSGRGTALELVNNASGIITINRAGSDTIEGDTSTQLSPGERFTLLPNGTSAWSLV